MDHVSVHDLQKLDCLSSQCVYAVCANCCSVAPVHCLRESRYCPYCGARILESDYVCSYGGESAKDKADMIATALRKSKVEHNPNWRPEIVREFR